MNAKLLSILCLAAAMCSGLTAELIPPAKYLHYALTREGDVRHGEQLFKSDPRLGCTRCHTVDGSASKAGPDLFAIGDKYGRRELIEAVLRPSASIAVGYSTTSIETKSGEDYTGIIKEATPTEIGLMGADGKLVRVPIDEIATRRTSEISLMPEGLQAGLSRQEFTDLVEYLVSLKQPVHSKLTHLGMPDNIPLLRHPIRLRPIHGPNLRFKHPVWFGAVPGETNVFLVAEQETGKVWRLTCGGSETKTLFLNTGHNDPGARGLIELAFDPNFAKNRKYYVAKVVEEHGQFASVIYEYEAAADFARDSGHPPRLILKVKAATNIDHAGALRFGPDGDLYIGMGDSGPSEDPQGHGQDTQSLLGKILRIDVDHHAPNRPYSIPSDNPFVGRPGFRPEIWAYGVREPWRFSFDRNTGKLWLADVGQDRYEEVDLVRRGENLGWNVYEGFEPFSNRYRRPGEHYGMPLFSYRRHYGACVIGGYVDRAKAHSSFYGVYVFGDYQSRRIFGLTQQHGVLKVVRQIGTSPQPISSFSQGPGGELYLVGYDGTIYRLNFSNSRFE